MTSVRVAGREVPGVEEQVPPLGRSLQPGGVRLAPAIPGGRVHVHGVADFAFAAAPAVPRTAAPGCVAVRLPRRRQHAPGASQTQEQRQDPDGQQQGEPGARQEAQDHRRREQRKAGKTFSTGSQGGRKVVTQLSHLAAGLSLLIRSPFPIHFLLFLLSHYTIHNFIPSTFNL